MSWREMLSLKICTLLNLAGVFECNAGGARSWEGPGGVGYEPTGGLRDDFSEGTVDVVRCTVTRGWDGRGNIAHARFRMRGQT